MDTRQFEYVLAIADERYVFKAADKLCISQPTLSQFLSRLENDLGVPLFHHSRNGFVPTPEGEIFIEGARRIMRIKGEILDKIAPFADRKKNRLIVGLTPGRSAALFSFVMPQFSSEAPEIEVQILEAPIQNIDELTRNGYLDLSLVIINKDDDQLVFEIFNEEEILFAVAGNHPLAPPSGNGTDGITAEIDVRIFAKEKFLMSKKGYRLRALVDSYLEKLELRPAVLMEATEIPLTCNMIRRGLGVGFIPAGFARAYHDLHVFSTSPKLTWDFGVAYRKGTRITPAMRRFIDL
ncbi:MAG: hypothetical protein A2Z99_00825, partial [Treponema sp. GWB1_62_6]